MRSLRRSGTATDELCYLPAHEALRMFRARKLSPVELMGAVIARAEDVEPTVHALVHRFFDRAVDEALEAEARYMGRGAAPRPLPCSPAATLPALTPPRQYSQ